MVWAEFQLWSLRGMVLRLSSIMDRRTAGICRSVPFGSQRRIDPQNWAHGQDVTAAQMLQ